jgi:hypothetical protein
MAEGETLMEQTDTERADALMGLHEALLDAIVGVDGDMRGVRACAVSVPYDDLLAIMMSLEDALRTLRTEAAERRATLAQKADDDAAATW